MKKYRHIFAALMMLFHCFISEAQLKSDFHDWAPTPPMGWNSWDCFGPTVTEAEVKANADYMAANLLKYGWEYVIVDIRWFVANDKAHGYNQQDPQYAIDSFGRLLPAVNRFPSAANGKGFRELADYLHKKGLKFGIHIMRGIPVLAVKKKMPIKGTFFTADQIYSEKDQCKWLKDMYTIRPDAQGAQEYYNSILQLYASWGVDFIKVDDLSSPIYFKEEVEMIRKAIQLTDRKILLSTSPGETPLAAASHVQEHANMWRTVGDFWDSWSQLKEHFAVFERWNPYRKTGAWPDGDMLPLGHLGIRAERGNDRQSNFTEAEERTLMSLWAMFRSPLFFGGDLPGTDSFTLASITNPKVLDILRYSTNNQPVFKTNNSAAWTATDARTGDRYLGLFNIADKPFALPEQALYQSPLVRSTTPPIEMNVKLKGARKLFLVVLDGGDNIEWDHADWIDPIVYNKTDTIHLDRLGWMKSSSGWGQSQLGKGVSGNPLRMNGALYSRGIGVHSNSLLEFDLPEGFTGFSAKVGIDQAAADQNTGATVQFLLFDRDPGGPEPPLVSKINFDLRSIDLKGSLELEELWTGQKQYLKKPILEVSVPRHGVALFKIKKS